MLGDMTDTTHIGRGDRPGTRITTMTIELKDASAVLPGKQQTGLAEDHRTLAAGFAGAHVNSKTDAIVVRFGKPALTDLYLYLDLSGAEELVASLNEQIDWLRNPNG
jgi:hypothetical protein